MQDSYHEWLKTKHKFDSAQGIKFPRESMLESLYEFQKDVTSWALMTARAALFLDTGMGKSHVELEWANKVPGRVLLLAPLAVARQTQTIANMIGIEAKYLRADDGETKIVIANYEMLDHFDPKNFTGIVIDESSSIKAFDGNFRTKVINWGQTLNWRLACSATPSPNDYMELGNHAEFLGVMRYPEMLATFFVNDTSQTGKWSLKKHAQDQFWQWVSSWAVFMNSPADLGYDGSSFELPPLTIHHHFVPFESKTVGSNSLIKHQVKGLDEYRAIRKESIDARIQKAREIIGNSNEPWLIWCGFNDESDALAKAFPWAVVVKGADALDEKIERLAGFQEGRYKQLITKVKIAGFGMNFQHCSKMLFFGLSHSFEQYYQAVRRCWRYKQQNPVDVHIVVTDMERSVVDTVHGKEEQLLEMRSKVMEYTREHVQSNLLGKEVMRTVEYKEEIQGSDKWTMYLGDCVEVAQVLPDDSVDYTIFSPPFADLFVYSSTERDMGNCRTKDEFAKHFSFLVPELFRITKPGRLLSFHCMQLPIQKYKDGYIGLRDWRGELIRLFVEAGWIYHSEVCIWKCPVTAVTRTKALGLLHKQLKKDSAMSRQGIADYLVTMRKPGDNPEPIRHTNESFPVELWQRYASPVWMDINQSRTLQYREARSDDDVKHICPLQLDVIERAVELWTNPNDLVLSPFAGIGSEGYVSVQKGRQFMGIELKEEYFEMACKNLHHAEQLGENKPIWDESVIEPALVEGG